MNLIIFLYCKKGTVGQIRTLLSSPDYGVRAIVASRRMVERIEKEVEGAINSNVSILAAILQMGTIWSLSMKMT